MRRKLLLALLFGLFVCAPALAGDITSQKQSVDSRLARLHEQIAGAQRQEQALTAEIASVTDRIQGLQARVVDVTVRLGTLERDLALHREKLARLTDLYRVETRRYLFLRRQYATSLQRLTARLVAIYEDGEPNTLDVVLSSDSLSGILDGVDYTREINAQDRRIARAVGEAKVEAHRARERTRHVRAGVVAETQTVAVRTEQVRALRDNLLAGEQQLASARSRKRVSLAHVKASDRQEVGEAQALESVSARLTAQIQAAQGSASTGPADSTPSASGLIWPVNGPVTSPFGMRWGRMHTGIDIGVPYGTPIRASAAGTVIYAGWMGGYGNLVVIDHGRGLATAYAHQSQIGVSNGQTVAQGQVIGYVGCTGHCFGPHLHFEVRINGQPVDPLAYL
ncbi:MAG: peptidoglycan DD-metalloendopeptidase family protein [Gaiellaceae bacterium]